MLLADVNDWGNHGLFFIFVAVDSELDLVELKFAVNPHENLLVFQDSDLILLYFESTVLLLELLRH